jgi:methionyl-tRNA synthetase
MVERYFDGVLPEIGHRDAADADLIGVYEGLAHGSRGNFDNMQFSLALTEIWRAVSRSKQIHR